MWDRDMEGSPSQVVKASSGGDVRSGLESDPPAVFCLLPADTSGGWRDCLGRAGGGGAAVPAGRQAAEVARESGAMPRRGNAQAQRDCGEDLSQPDHGQSGLFLSHAP